MTEQQIYTAYLDGDLVLTNRGEWTHRGVLFSNPKLSALFHRSIVWDESQRRYLIRIGNQQATFTCEDCAYFVVSLIDQGSVWQLVLNDGSEEPLLPGTLSRGAESQFYALVKNGHRARFQSPAHQTLIMHAVDDNTLEVAGEMVRLTQ